MKNITKHLLPLLLVLVILCSSFVTATASSSGAKVVTTPTGYTKASDVVYETENSYILNWGARGENCVFLSKYAADFYTGGNTYSTLSQLSGSTSQNSVPQSDLYKALQKLMKNEHEHETNYGETRYQYCYTDCVRNDSSKISSFYSGTLFKSQWDSGATWNREHTWPNSKGLGGNDENDIMMLRPTLKDENFSRSNTAYGEGSDFFDPGVSVRGDCARIALYIYTRWGNTGKMWGSSGVIESLDILLKWMAEDPVDTWEMGRNDSVQSITGTRNVFIDYPELAWRLFGKSVPSGLTTPSQGKGSAPTPNVPTTPAATQPATPATQPATQPVNSNTPVVGNASAISSMSQLVSGQYVLVADSGYAPGVLDGTWLTAVQPTVSGGKVTDAKGAVWTIAVSGNKVTLTDANGVTVGPKGGNNNGIKANNYQWEVVCENGKFSFKGTGSDTVRLASNTDPQYGNKFRGYKNATVADAETYPSTFTLYAVSAGGSTPSNPGATNPSTAPTTPTQTPSQSGTTVVATPATGTAYKLGMFQGNLSKTLYMTGNTANAEYYLETTENMSDAVDVFLEQTSGGYYIYFIKNGAKTYIDIYQNITDTKTYTNIRLVSSPSVVFVWNAEYKTLTTTVAGEDFCLGSYNTFNTFSASKMSKIATSFPANLYTVSTSNTPSATTPTQAPTQAPTQTPTQAPTQAPGQNPTQAPTQAPVQNPTQAPTQNSTQAPVQNPTQAPVQTPTQPASGAIVEAPATGTGFKFGMFQGNLSKTLYITGNTANKDYYLETTENAAEAVDVFLENTSGGYYIYFTKDGVKTYIDIYQNGDYVNIRLASQPGAVFVWNTEYKTLTTKVNGEDYYMGTYNQFNTLSASKLSFASSSFPSNLYAFATPGNPTDPAPTTPATGSTETTTPATSSTDVTTPSSGSTEATTPASGSNAATAPATTPSAPAGEPGTPDTESNAVIWIILSVVLVAGAGAAVWFYLRKRNEANAPEEAAEPAEPEETAEPQDVTVNNEE